MKRVLNAPFILLAVFAVSMLLFSAKENTRLKRENEVLILKSDSLHMLQLKTKKDLINSNNKIDSIHTNFSFRKKVK